ncbi:hypothetical protein FBU30_002329, partial [Linnemannia zychae]
GIFDPQKQHVSCLAHVINLAVQALLGKGGLGAESPEDMERDIDDDGIDGGSDDDAGDAFTSFNIGEDPDLINGDLFANTIVDGTLLPSNESMNEDDYTNIRRTLQKLRTGLKKI